MHKLRVGDGNVVPSQSAVSQYELYNDRASIYNHFYGRNVRDVKYVMSSQMLSMFALPLQVVKVQGVSEDIFYYGIKFPTLEQVMLEVSKHENDNYPSSICVSSLPHFIRRINRMDTVSQFYAIIEKQQSMLTNDVLRLFSIKENIVQGNDVKAFLIGLSNKEHIAFVNKYHKFAEFVKDEVEAMKNFIERWKLCVMLNPILDIEAVVDGSIFMNQYTYVDAISTMSARMISPDYKSEPIPSFLKGDVLTRNNMPRDNVPVIIYVQRAKRDINAFFLYDGRFNVVIVDGSIKCPYSNMIVATSLLLYMNKILDTLRIAGFNKSMNASKFVPLVFPYPSIFIGERLNIDLMAGLEVPGEYYIIFHMYVDYLATGHVNDFITRTSPHFGLKVADNHAIYDQAQVFQKVLMRGAQCSRSLDSVSIASHLLSDCVIPENIMAFFYITTSNYMSIGYPDYQPVHTDPKHNAPIIIDPPNFSRILHIDTEINGDYQLIHNDSERTFHGYMKNTNALINFILTYKIHKQSNPHILYLGGANGKSLILVRLLFPNISFTVVDPLPMNYQHDMRLKYLAEIYNVTLQPLTYVKEYFKAEYLGRYHRKTYIYSDVFIMEQVVSTNMPQSQMDEVRLRNGLATTLFHHDILREAVRLNGVRMKSDDKLDRYVFLAMGVKFICPYSDGIVTVGNDVYIHGYQKYFSGHEGRYYINFSKPISEQVRDVSCVKLANALVVASLVNKRSFYNTAFSRNMFYMMSSVHHQFCPCYNCFEWLLNYQSAFIESGLLCPMNVLLHNFFTVMNSHMAVDVNASNDNNNNNNNNI